MPPLCPGQATSHTNSVFQGVVFFLTGETSAVTEARLRVGGARKASYLSGIVTHCVAGAEPEDAEVAEAEELLELPVVREEWVKLSVRCGKMLPVGGFRVAGGQLFSGVSVRVVGLGREDVESIWAMVTWHGGRVVVGDGGVVTHEVTGVVGVGGGGDSGGYWIVTPDWLVDSVRRGQRMLEVMYNKEMILVQTGSSVQTSLPYISSSVSSAPARGRSKYYCPGPAPVTTSSLRTVVTAILSSSKEEVRILTACQEYKTDYLQTSFTLRPLKLSFPQSVVSVSQETNGNTWDLAGVGGRKRLESIREDERGDVEGNREELDDCLVSGGGHEKDLRTDRSEKWKLSDITSEEPKESGVEEAEKVATAKNKTVARNCLDIGVRKRSQAGVTKIDAMKVNIDKSKRRRSVRLMGKEDSIMAALEESCAKINLKEDAVATRSGEDPTKKSSKFIHGRPKRETKPNPKYDPETYDLEQMLVPASSESKLKAKTQSLNTMKSSALSVKTGPAVAKLQVKRLARRSDEQIQAADQLEKVGRTASAQLVENPGSGSCVVKVHGGKENRRRSIRLMVKGK